MGSSDPPGSIAASPFVVILGMVVSFQSNKLSGVCSEHYAGSLNVNILLPPDGYRSLLTSLQISDLE